MPQLFKIITLVMLVQGCTTDSNNTNSDFVWLENLDSEGSVEWIKNENMKTTSIFGNNPRFRSMQKNILDRSNNNDKLKPIFFIGDEVAQISRSTNTSKGVLQSITIEESKKAHPKWKKLLDFNYLSKKESKEFVFGTSRCNLIQIKQCLIGLSFKGADKVEYREFDLSKRKFIKNGFVIPGGQTNVAWVDKNTIIFSSSFKGEKITQSGYGATLKIWERGKNIDNAKEILHITDGDGIDVTQHLSNGNQYTLVHHWLGFYDGIIYLFENNQLKKINLPTSLELYGMHKDFVVLKLYKEWKIKGKTFPVGSLIGVDINSPDFNNPKIELIFEQNDRQSFDLVNLTKSKILLNVIEDMQTTPLTLEKRDKPNQNQNWVKQYIKQPSNDVLRIRATSLYLDESIVGYRGFLTPNSLYFLDVVNKNHRFWDAAPKAFDINNLAFSYHFAQGDDGVKIPYQMVAPKNLALNKNHPVMIYVYGAYGDPNTAWYSANLGKEWLEKGGVFIIANVRGGGAYGERWHQAAIKTTKHKTTEDIATVALDLIKRRITNNKKIGVRGESLGGLSACSAITVYPELFNAALCKSPLTDLIRYTKLSNGSTWIDELGNPELPEEKEYLFKHSPYHAVKKGANIPPILFITYANDDRVHPGHARRMVAKMEEQGMLAYLYESPEGGHNGATTKAERAKIIAMEYEYFKQRLFD